MGDKTVEIKKVLNERDGYQVWWRILRPHTLTASFIPVFVGTMYAYMVEQVFHLWLFSAMMIAALLIQAATNMFNEYYDYVLGLDTEQSVRIGGTIVRDGIAPKSVLRLGFIFFGIAVLIGIYISAMTSWWIAAIGAFSMLIGYLYTGGPIPIAYTPFGEIVAGFLMGTVMIGISYFIQTLTVTKEVLLISIPIAIFIGAILLSNNIRDLDNDKESGRKTIAILIGRKNAIILLALLFALAYILTIFSVIKGVLPVWSLLTLVSVIKAIEVIVKFRGKTEPLEMMPAMVATGKTNSMYGFLLGISFILTKFIG